VLVKKEVTTEIAYNFPTPALSAEVPAGKYNFQFFSELAYFNNNVATTKTRYLRCLITTNSDGPTAFGIGYANQVLWPSAGAIDTVRTSFAPSSASTAMVGTQTFALSGVLDLSSNATIYLQCQNEHQSGDAGSSGQLAKFVFPTFTFVKTNEISAIS
jgi:hypothetical protein